MVSSSYLVADVLRQWEVMFVYLALGDMVFVSGQDGFGDSSISGVRVGGGRALSQEGFDLFCESRPVCFVVVGEGLSGGLRFDVGPGVNGDADG